MKVVKDQTKPGYDMNAERPETTYSPEYIRDRARVDQLAKTIQNQILQLNKQLDTLQITDFGFKLTNPGEHKAPIKAKKRIWMRMIKFIAWFAKVYKSARNAIKIKFGTRK